MDVNDWIGSVGVFLILLAYFLTVTNKISNKHIAFILLNLIGALLAALASVLINYIPFIILESAWAVVSLFSLVKYYKSQQLVN